MAEALLPVVGGVAGGLVVPPPPYGPPPVVVELPQAAKNMAMKMLRAITKERFRNIAYSPSMYLLSEQESPRLSSDLIRKPISSVHSQPVTPSSWSIRCRFAASPGTRRRARSALIPMAVTSLPSKRYRPERHCMSWLTTRITLAIARKSPLSIEPPKATLGRNHGAGRPSRKK